VKGHKAGKKRIGNKNPMAKMTQVTVVGRNHKGQLGFEVSNKINAE